jgi:hypothetical protein
VGDFNGDGKDDVVNYHPDSGTWWVNRSTGSGFVQELWATFGTKTGWDAQLVGDFTGDDSDDVANYHSTSGRWWINRSTTFAFVQELWATFNTKTGWDPQIVGDFTGDGKDDVVNYHSAKLAGYPVGVVASHSSTQPSVDNLASYSGFQTSVVNSGDSSPYRVYLPIIYRRYGWYGVEGTAWGWNSWYQVQVADGGTATVSAKYYTDNGALVGAKTFTVDGTLAIYQKLDDEQVPRNFIGAAVLESNKPIAVVADVSSDAYTGDADAMYEAIRP